MAFDASPRGAGASAPAPVLAGLSGLLLSGLTLGALQVLALLHELAARGRDTVSADELAETLDKDRSTARRHLHALEEAGRVALERRQSGDGASIRTRFRLLDEDRAAPGGAPGAPGGGCMERAEGVHHMHPLMNEQTPAAREADLIEVKEGEGRGVLPAEVAAWELGEGQAEAIRARFPTLCPRAELEAWRDWHARKPDRWPDGADPWGRFQGWCEVAARNEAAWRARHPHVARSREARSGEAPAPRASTAKAEPVNLPDELEPIGEEVRARVGEEAWTSWFGGTSWRINGSALAIDTASRFAAGKVRERYGHLLEELAGRPVTIDAGERPPP